MPRTYSGKEVVRILTRDFGFEVIGQKGSHIKLRTSDHGVVATTIVPMHRELALGTLKGALKLAKVNEKDFRASK